MALFCFSFPGNGSFVQFSKKQKKSADIISKNLCFIEWDAKHW